MKLSPSMHALLIGESFMTNRRSGVRVTSATGTALKRRGLVDDTYHRTQAGLDYVQKHCECIDDRLRADYPNCPMIYSDAGLLHAYRIVINNFPSIFVYRGRDPLLVKDGNGSQPVAVLSATYMWEIEVKLVGSMKKRAAGRFLMNSPVAGHKGSYEYVFDRERTEELINSTCVEISPIEGF